MRNWAITIGINGYRNLQRLNYAKRDAESVRAYFSQEVKFERIYHFSDDSLPIQQDHGADLDSQPTYSTLRRFLRVRFDNPFLQAGDNLWFFFAGHGIRHEDRDYLMPIDADPGDVENSAVSLHYVTERLRRCGADNVVMFLDVCRSGLGRRHGLGFGSEKQPGVITFFSCSPNESSYEIDELQQGSFTHILLQGLRLQGEGNCATVERLDQYLRHHVPNLNRHYRKYLQTPYSFVEPLNKSHLILLPLQATLTDLLVLKKDAYSAEIKQDFQLAKQFWIRVLTVSHGDSEAIEGIERLARISLPPQTLPSQASTQPPLIVLSVIPDSFIAEIATQHGVTRTELDALLLALADRPGAEIAKTLAISEAAVRKRLGEIYKKFHIEVGGNKKLTYLKQKLLVEYEARQQDEAEAHQDWGEAVDVEDFCGREAQLTELDEWIVGDAIGSNRSANRCRLVAVLGIGGIGKTTLAARIAQRVQYDFKFLIWRSLRNAPPLTDILAELLKFLPSDSDDLPEDENSRILRLFQVLREHRCLIILDNVESILRSGEGKDYDRAGEYKDGYEMYGYLFKKLGEAAHQSCLLLTSREKPKDVTALEGKNLPIKVLQLDGLNQADARLILKDKGLGGSDAELCELVDRYSGNPLALKIVATTIYNLFNNTIAEFLAQTKQETAVYGDVRALLEQQFERLSNLEKRVMYWLAINRDPVSLSELRNDIPIRESPMRLLEAVESLSRRSIIVGVLETGKLSQLPVIMEYTTEQLIEQVTTEIEELLEQPDEAILSWRKLWFLNSYSLVKAASLDHIRKAQEKGILEPIKTKLLDLYATDLEAQIRRSFDRLRDQPLPQKGYAIGNLINLLCQLQSSYPQADLSGRDFSALTIWRAYLKNVKLQDTSFTNADLTGSVFAEILGLASPVSVQYSPDGKFFATGMGDGEIRLWQASDNKQIQLYKGHNTWVWALAFSPDSSLLVSGSADSTIRIWDVQTGVCLQTLNQHTNKVCSVAFSPDGQTIASASEDHTLKIWDVSSGDCRATLKEHTDWVWSVAFNPIDPHRLVSSSADGTIKLWDSQGHCLQTLLGHTSQVFSVRFSPNGQILASSSEDQTVKLWDVQTGQCFETLRGHSKKVYAVRFSPDGKTLASCGEDRAIKLWNSQTSECLKTLTGHISQVWSISFSPDGRTLLSSSDDQAVRLWDATNGTLLNVLQGYSRGVYAVAFSADGQTVASGGDDTIVRLWDVHQEKRNPLEQPKSKGRLRSIAFSPCEPILATGGSDYTIRLWDLQDNRQHNRYKALEGHTNWVWTVTFSPNGRLLASSSEDRTLRLWDATTGQCLKTLEGHTHWVWTVAFSPDGQTLASGSADSNVKLWDVTTGLCVKTLAAHKEMVWSVAFSPDGRSLVSGSEDQTIRLWDVGTGKCLKTFKGHTKQIYAIAVSPDGRALASGSGDATVKLWNINTGACLDTLRRGHTAAIRALAFSPDGTMLVSGSEDGSVQLWDVQKCSRVRQLKFDRIYEGMDITGVTGLTEAQKSSLKALGAVESEVIGRSQPEP